MYKKVSILLCDKYKYHLLQIYDNNTLVCNKIINNKCDFNGKTNKAYRLKIISKSYIYNTSIYIDKNSKNYNIDLNNINTNHKIFIILKDQNYKGLKIKKGEITLWQKHTILQ